jgi:sulfite exporter TauE/SafE
MGGRWRRLSLIRIGDASASPVSRAAGRLLRSTSVSSKLALGLVLGLLPCGMVYAALIKAIETGSAVSGALTMVAFGLGTSGALLTIGLFSTAITARLGRHASTVAAASVAVLGAYLLWRGLAAPSPMGAHGHGHHS